MEQETYSRCKACDTAFYPRWRERQQSFEELCSPCLRAAFAYDSSDTAFIEGFLSDKIEPVDMEYDS